MPVTTFCVWLFANFERKIGGLEAHVGTIVALDCFISAGEFTPNDQSLKHLSSWLDEEERFVRECSSIFFIGSYGRRRKYGIECARHARDILKSMERTVSK